MPEQPHWKPALLVFLLTFALLWVVHADRLRLNVDEGIYLDGALRSFNGETLYRDFLVHTGPGTFWLCEAAFRLFGVDGWTFVVDGLVLCVAWGVVLLGSGVVRWPGYFREPLLANLLVEIGTDRVPTAAGDTSHSARTFDVPAPPKRKRRLRRWLRHSAICESEDVVAAIGDCVSARSAR